MILVIDIGNTNIKIGIFDNDKLTNSWRLNTDTLRTADEYGASLLQLFDGKKIDKTLIEGSIMSSVIPQLNYTIEHMLKYYFNTKPLIVSAGIKIGLNIKYENPKELGSDRILNCVAAKKKYGMPFIVVDFGTATTFNAVNAKGDFLGGCIMPGVKSALEAFTKSTAKLPKIELIKPSTVIGRTTVSNMQSGVIYGLIGQVSYLIKQIKEEMNEPNIKVIATGGLSELVFDEAKEIDVVDRTLSLEGLKIIYDMNKKY